MVLEIMVTGGLQVNTTLVGCEDTKEAMIVDPGDNAVQILERVSHHGLNLTTIALTHAHVDHIGALPELVEKSGAKLVMHKKEEDVYLSAKSMGPMFGIHISQLPKIDRYLEESENFKVGNLDIKVIFTPGHTPGGITFHLKSDEGKDVLIAGDTVFMGSIGRTDFPGGNYNTLISSIKDKLLSFPDDTVIISGHGPLTTVGREKTSNPFLI